PKEARAWTVPEGTRAPQAAGVIHTDFETGFIRAETIAYDDYVALSGEAGARDAGKLRLEGKDYVVKDGDVLHFRSATWNLAGALRRLCSAGLRFLGARVGDRRHRLWRGDAHRHIDIHQPLDAAVRRLDPISWHIDQRAAERHGRGGDDKQPKKENAAED